MWFINQFMIGPVKLFLIAVLCCGILLWLIPRPTPTYLSPWNGGIPQSTSVPGIVGVAKAVVSNGTPPEQYHQGSTLQDATGDGSVRFFRRTLPGGGTLAYTVVRLGPQVHVAVLNADGATPGSDASGDTIWTDGKQHLATVEAMVHAPYAARDGMELLTAMAFGFHGADRTSDEGTVAIDGKVLRVNPWRAALCLSADAKARIGLFDAKAVQQCTQAIGGGPVILLNGKIANPAVASATDEFVPFNPLNENFVQLDWRKKIYTGDYPKTAIGVGGDGSFVVLATSYGMNGVDLARQLKAMGCVDALGGDDDTSTQAVWRGGPVQPRAVRAVPDAIAVWWKK